MQIIIQALGHELIVQSIPTPEPENVFEKLQPFFPLLVPMLMKAFSLGPWSVPDAGSDKEPTTPESEDAEDVDADDETVEALGRAIDARDEAEAEVARLRALLDQHNIDDSEDDFPFKTPPDPLEQAFKPEIRAVP